MRGILHVDPADAAPIWRQIEEGVRRLVVARRLPPDTPVPSVRDLAKDLGVNPATVAKAYQRLVDAGVLAVRRGEGTYVAPAPPALEAPDLARQLREGGLRFASLALGLGADREEAERALKEAWSELSEGGRR